jgi:hypothetical protein
MEELTWQKAIQMVLASSTGPLHYKEITERILADGLRINIGATPVATVNAQITQSLKNEGSNSPYIRVTKGTYSLRDTYSVLHDSSASLAENDWNNTSTIVQDDVDEQYAIFTAFGMFWRREYVEWFRSPMILGMQQIGAKPVDFSHQRGIYLLYDEREVIYVGRVTDRGLGLRLYEHTRDRLSTRWNRFSWFGLVPVSELGDLGAMPHSYESSKLVPALEAILVEALEPRQNRKRGDDLAEVEYIQKVDPAIEKRRAKAYLDQIFESPSIH